MLSVRELCGSYRSGVAAFAGVSLELERGAIGFIGRNGAGKSCLALTLSGALAAAGGSITFQGEDITHVDSRDRVLRGIALVPEGRQVFGQLTVRENLVVAANVKGSRSRAISVIESKFPVLGRKRDHLAASLSGGEQQLLAIGRALVQSPSVLILDEPSLGLSPVAIDALTQSLGDILSDGQVAMVLMEQNSEMLTGLCKRVYLMDQGRVGRSLDMSSPEDQESLFETYLGA